ncbi:MAG: 2-oxoglutarate dehydrogenase complex dihydrolipoyllysine-residue succinyltransferase [Anaerolineales bacterium]|nr:2-oxoglutarate dehydrogenase complex dihydrolipoyllysine-residue succinyltransferase [Anaerolineales bacterium]MCZ2120661.1 2-oxoglutarate dehydrogenase complex dihydrolipoyllysine-residue succinyltransferase [Anaerolineales bacterium]
MTVQVLVPEMGESVIEATVSRWLKKEGEAVNVGDILVELETDKINLEVGAKSSGVLSRVAVAEGKDVKVGDVLAEIDETAEGASAPQVEKAVEQKENNKAPREVPQATPVASRMAREQNVDVAQLSGTGVEGRVTKTDVQQYLQGREQSQSAAKPASVKSEAQPVKAVSRAIGERSEERVRMSRRRQTIAKRLLEAQQTTAMLTTFNEVDMGAVMELRKRRNDEFQAKYGIKLGLMSFFVKASISALKAFPRLNGEIQGDEIVLKNYYDIGMAVGAEEGLVVPVIRNADQLSYADIEREIKVFVTKANEGKLSIEDLRGGSFTITNGGIFGSLLSTPILNPPQVGILGLHKIEERPIALNGQVVIRKMMYLALSYDHRIVDGSEAVQFLVHVKQMIEDPALMLFD